jgi:hypothetical protein
LDAVTTTMGCCGCDRGICIEQLERAESVTCLQHTKTREREGSPKHLPEIRVVLHDENRAHGSR